MSVIPLEPLRSSVAAHLDKAAVVDWALETLRSLRTLRLTAEVAELEAAWFGDATRVARWIADDEPSITRGLLRELPSGRFSAAVEVLAERWSSWSGERAAPAARILAELAPQRAAALFRQQLDLDPKPERHILTAILAAAGLLGVEGQRLEDQALSRLPIGDEPTTVQWLAPRLRSAAGLEAPATVTAVVRWLRSGHFGDRLGELAEQLFSHAACFEFATDLALGHSTLRFSALASLFPAEAPLERWSALLVADPETALPELVRELEASSASARPAAFTARLVASLAQALAPEEQSLLAAFAVAGLAHGWELSAPAFDDLSAGELLNLADLWLPTVPFHRALARCLALRPRREVLDWVSNRVASRLALDLPPNSSPRLLEVLGELEEPELAPLFVDCLEESAADACLDAATAALVRLREVAVGELVRRWSALDDCQHSYGLEVLTAGGSQAATEFLIERFDELADELTDQFADATPRLCDARLLDPLADLIQDGEPWAAQPFLVLATLLGVAHPRLEEARARWAKLEEEAREQSENPSSSSFDGQEFPLTCTACGHRALYACQTIFWSQESGDEPVLADEVPCAGCGRFTDLLPVPETWPRLRAELARAAEGWGESDTYPLVQTERLEFPNGRSVPLSAHLTQLRHRQTESPNDLGAILDRAVAQQNAHRFRAASDLYRRALELDPTAIEAFWSLTHCLLDRGLRRAAFAVLRQALEHERHWHFSLARTEITPTDLRRRFAELYNQLRQTLAATDTPPAPSSLTEKKAKVGRNDPCPCGSGLKYKKCCGR